MLAHSKTMKHNQWTRHVLKSHHSATPESHNHSMRNAFVSLQQKKSLEDLFHMLDNSIAGKPTVVKGNCKTVRPKIEDKNEQHVSSSTRIPRLHNFGSPEPTLRKRPSLEIPADLSPSCLKRRRSLKDGKTVSFHVTSPRKGEDSQTFQKGDKVKIVQGAKKKFLGLTGLIEKYLFQKCKWGIALDNGSRIALGPECLKMLVSEDTLNTAAALRRARNTAKRAEPKNVPEPKLMRIHTAPMQGRSLAPRGSTSRALPFIPDLHSIVPATEEQIAEFVSGFPKECRPKNVRQIMIAACVTGRKNIVVSLIVNSKIDVNVDFATAGLLHVTIMNDQPEVSLLLMEMGIEVDHQDSKGCTPLILAAQRGLRSVVAALCLAGADVNQANNRKQTPLMVAAMHGHLGIVDILLENEADVQLQDDMAQNALTMAMSSEDAPHRQVVDRLISRMYAIHSKEQTTATGIKKQ